VSDDSRLAAGHHADEEVSDSRSERSDVAVRCAAVNKRAARRLVTMLHRLTLFTMLDIHYPSTSSSAVPIVFFFIFYSVSNVGP